MFFPIPSAADVRACLRPLRSAVLQSLSAQSGVPLPTISKIQRGETTNPGIETVRRLWPHLARCSALARALEAAAACPAAEAEAA